MDAANTSNEEIKSESLLQVNNLENKGELMQIDPALSENKTGIKVYSNSNKKCTAKAVTSIRSNPEKSTTKAKKVENVTTKNKINNYNHESNRHRKPNPGNQAGLRNTFQSASNAKSQHRLPSEYSTDFCGDYIVTFVSGYVGVHLQSPSQQCQHEMLKKKMPHILSSKKRTAIKEIEDDKNKVYCAYLEDNVYRAKIIRSTEGFKGMKRYLCSDIDTGICFYTNQNYIFELPEELNEPKPLAEFRYLKNVYAHHNIAKNKDSTNKMYSCLKQLLHGKYLTVGNPSHYHVDIYYRNEYLNPKISRIVQHIFTEENPSLSSNISSNLMDFTRGSMNGHSKGLSAIPNSHPRYMSALRNDMYSQSNTSFGEESTSSKNKVKNNFLSITSLIAKNFEKRTEVSTKVSEDSIISKASEYILKNSSFYSEIDDLQCKGDDLLTRRRYSKNNGNNKVEQCLTQFYVKRDVINMSEMKSTLQDLAMELRLSCTIQEIQNANQERKIILGDCERSFYTFIKEFNVWKINYMESQIKTNELLKAFINEQKELVTWTENMLLGGANPSQKLSFDSIQKLHEQLVQEENLYLNQNWVTHAVMMTSEEIERRLKKINKLIKTSLDIDEEFSDCSYQTNKHFSSETSLPLLTFIKPPNVLAPEIKCFYICDIYRELSSYHEKGSVYQFLNPSNVLIIDNGQVILRSPSQAEKGEPFPPWTFGAPECYNSEKITPAADVYSFGQFILWLACVHVNRNFDQDMRRIKQDCPILEKMADDKPQLRPRLQDVEKWFVTLFPKAFGVTYSEKHAVSPKSRDANLANTKSVVIQRPNSPSNIVKQKVETNRTASITSSKSQQELDNMKYELSLIRELQDSDSDGGDLEDDLANMLALSNN